MIDLEYILWVIWNTFYDWFVIYFMIDLEYILWLICNILYDWFGIHFMIDLLLYNNGMQPMKMPRKSVTEGLKSSLLSLLLPWVNLT